MTTKEASDILGCSMSQVRYLIRTKKIAATEVKANNRTGYIYDVPMKELQKVMEANPNGRGWPRGQGWEQA